MLAMGPDDLGKLTVAQMNVKIDNLIRAGEESDASEAESNSTSEEFSEDSDTDSGHLHKKKKTSKEND